MATGKPKSGAGPYAGYKKNYAPIKSSKGTKAEKVVGKVLAAGSSPSSVKTKYGKAKMSEGGLGVVGTMAKAVARTAARNEGRIAKGLTQKEMRDLRANRVPYRRRDELNMAEKGRGEGGKIRSGIGGKAVSQRRSKIDQLNKEQLKRGITSKESVRGRLSSSVASKKPNYGASISSRMKTSPVKRKK